MDEKSNDLVAKIEMVKQGVIKHGIKMIVGLDFYHEPKMQIDDTEFDQLFPGVVAFGRECEVYPYKKEIMVGGVQYFAIYKEV